ncbi:hypothetical protein CVT26_005912 [Gymnopilus dilepis]|uniref:Uncharacterized protein n=1 Tax=Gymnopilus dilepis TaxID=231916 RepID=A0A409Y1M5_9AGAR|nr:hypothetical protein CVT26_005912 [Gymnopilus dilepis]
MLNLDVYVPEVGSSKEHWEPQRRYHEQRPPRWHEDDRPERDERRGRRGRGLEWSGMTWHRDQRKMTLGTPMMGKRTITRMGPGPRCGHGVARNGVERDVGNKTTRKLEVGQLKSKTRQCIGAWDPAAKQANEVSRFPNGFAKETADQCLQYGKSCLPSYISGSVPCCSGLTCVPLIIGHALDVTLKPGLDKSLMSTTRRWSKVWLDDWGEAEDRVDLKLMFICPLKMTTKAAASGLHSTRTEMALSTGTDASKGHQRLCH